ncbi:SulP family inorganic anion transporter [Hydrogenophaga sp. OTU3427]|uniref:SulP family inorganic anion transporter n=1 Tax=Hydrogenophaga sp. OTU3427 TaxID=3043856 RepID=UPI00313E46D5
MSVSLAPSPLRRLGARLFGPWVFQVSGPSLRADALAGLLGTVLALPQGIAFAALAGLPIEMGIYSAIVPTLVAALFGSSWHVVSGPTNALSLALLSMLAPLAATGSAAYVQLALAITLLVGLMQWLIGALRLGALANFISPTALFGFTAGAALLIAVYALVDVLGLQAHGVRGAPAVLAHLAGQWQLVTWQAPAVAGLTLVVAWGLRWRWPRSPHLLLGLVAGTVLAVVLQRGGWQGEALRQVGAMPSPWPQPSLPRLEWARLPELLSMAFAMTIVALGQTISIAKAVAARSGQRIDANREFMGQGLANVAGAFFSCYVSCGSLNRSVPNLQAGARTPLAAVLAALFMLVLVGAVSGWLAQIPMAAIAALLLLVAWSLFDLRRWRELWRVSRRDFWIAAATLLATVTLRLEMAIVLGTLLSLTVFLHRTSRPAMRSMGFDSPPDRPAANRPFVVLGNTPGALPECPQLKLLRMEGEVYFGAVQHVADTLHAQREAPGAQRHLLVMGKSMNFIDLAGAELWADELRARRAMGGDLYFHRPRPEVIEIWQRTGFDRWLGADHLFPDKATAIASIVPRLDSDICGRCRARIFKECETRPKLADNVDQP